MPPARKTVYAYQVVAEAGAKRPLPRHLINIQDLVRVNDDKNQGQGHLVISINKDSPEEISIKRSGDKLTVETKSGDNLQGGEVEHVTRCYKVPEGGYTPELGAQLSVDGLVSVGNPGIMKMSPRVIPINITGLEQLKHGTVIKVDPMTGHQTVFPMSFPSYVTKPNTQGMQQKISNPVGDEKEMTDNHKPPGCNADEEMGVLDDGPDDTQVVP